MIRPTGRAQLPCLQSGDYERAIQLLIDHGGVEQLIILSRKLPKDDANLKTIAKYFMTNKHFKFAKEVYVKMEAVEALMKLLMSNSDWEEAMDLASKYPGQFDDSVFEPYAQYLAGEDRFEEAQAAYRRAGKPTMAIKLVESLAQNACIEGRFPDAARHYFELAEEHLDVVAKLRRRGTQGTPSSGSERVHLRKAKSADEMASLYPPTILSGNTEEPFTTLDTETVFNVSRYLLNMLGGWPRPRRYIAGSRLVRAGADGAAAGSVQNRTVGIRKIRNLCRAVVARLYRLGNDRPAGETIRRQGRLDPGVHEVLHVKSVDK